MSRRGIALAAALVVAAGAVGALLLGGPPGSQDRGPVPGPRPAPAIDEVEGRPAPPRESVMDEAARAEGAAAEAPGASEPSGAPSATASVFGAVDTSALRHAADASLQVVALEQLGLELRELGRADVGPGGAWGPLELELGAGPSWVVRLLGDGVVPDEETLPVPVAGETRRVDLVAHPGHDVRVRVTDANGEPVLGAEVSAYWFDGVAWRDVTSTSGPGGRVVLRGCPPGFARVGAVAPGFAERVLDEPAPVPSDVELVLVLSGAGTVRGRVLAGGEPHPDFELVFWSADPSTASSVSVRDSSDGSFEIPSAPFGEVTLLAFSDAHPASAPVTVYVGRDAPAFAELELEPALVGGGRVLDERTREPIEGARIQPYVNHGAQLLTPWGPPARTDADGRFEMRAFASGDTRLGVQASGYATFYGGRVARRGELVEFGDVLLERTQTVRLRLLGDADPDALDHVVVARGTAELPAQSVRPGGVVEWHEVPPGTYWFAVVAPGGSEVVLTVELVAGRDWTLELPASGEQSVVVRARTPDGAPPAGGAWFLATTRGPAGSRLEHSGVLDAAGEGRVAGLRATHVTVEVLDVEGYPLGIGSAALAPSGATSVDVELTDRWCRLRVVDAQGRGVAGARVQLTPADDASGWNLEATTDAEGRFSYRGLAGECWASITHPSRGTVTGQRVTVPRDSDREVELPFRADGRLALALVDPAGAPAAGVRVELFDERSGQRLRPGRSDGEGRATWEPLGGGPYVARVDSDRHWTSTVGGLYAAGGAPVRVAVLPLGQLELVVRDGAGLALAGAHVELRRLEALAGDGRDVAAWLADPATPTVATGGALATDPRGRLLVQGLPVGRYAFSVAHPDGRREDGELSVTAGATREQLVAF